MKVRVVKAEIKSLWYSDRIGEVFDVIDNGGKYYDAVNVDRCINKQDAEVVEDVEKSPNGWSCGMQAGKFENIGRSLGELVDEKQQAYGDAITAVEQMMKVLYPNGVNPDQYRDILLMVRIMDKQCRIAKGDKTAFGESPFKDIAGYGLLGVGHGS